jgi:hypothetical protein
METYLYPDEADFRTCGALYHTRELRLGYGPQLHESAEHEHAPCGHSQSLHGWSPAWVEPEPNIGLEIFDEED